MEGFYGRTSEKVFGLGENLTKLKFVKKKQTTDEFGEELGKVESSLVTVK
jgi:hypothetical protein